MNIGNFYNFSSNWRKFSTYKRILYKYKKLVYLTIVNTKQLTNTQCKFWPLSFDSVQSLILKKSKIDTFGVKSLISQQMKTMIFLQCSMIHTISTQNPEISIQDVKFRYSIIFVTKIYQAKLFPLPTEIVTSIEYFVPVQFEHTIHRLHFKMQYHKFLPAVEDFQIFLYHNS
jgi:hypothetical protein